MASDYLLDFLPDNQSYIVADLVLALLDLQTISGQAIDSAGNCWIGATCNEKFDAMLNREFHQLRLVNEVRNAIKESISCLLLAFINCVNDNVDGS
jgi:hypothetical protein